MFHIIYRTSIFCILAISYHTIPETEETSCFIIYFWEKYQDFYETWTLWFLLLNSLLNTTFFTYHVQSFSTLSDFVIVGNIRRRQSIGLEHHGRGFGFLRYPRTWAQHQFVERHLWQQELQRWKHYNCILKPRISRWFPW